MNNNIYLYHYKNFYLLDNNIYKFKEINLEEFFYYIFNRNNEYPFENKGKDNYIQGKYNSICVEINNKTKKNKNHIITNDLEKLKDIKGKDFVIGSPITYIGRNRNSNNSRYIYGLAFDIDGVKENHIKDILHQMSRKVIPAANIIVNSGNGVHLYYLFEKPIALFNNIKPLLKKLKYNLTSYIWNAYTSSIKEKQYQGIFQGFRLPETKTKFNTEVKAFYNISSKYHTIATLNDYVNNIGYKDNNKLTDDEIEMIEKAMYKPNRISRAKAKELYPDWYERRIIKGEQRQKWNIKRDLYDWWLRILRNEEENKVKEGHRYFCLMTLSMYAIKCNVPYEELKADAYSLLDKMENLTLSNDNHFTVDDIEDALKAYLDNYATFPRKDIEKITAIIIPPNKRNYRKQLLHLKIARANKNILKEAGEIREGRPKGAGIKENIVINWRVENPQGNKAQCIKDTGLSKKTVYKYWDIEKN